MNIVADRAIPFVKTLFSTIGDVSLHDGRHIRSSDLVDADVLVVRTVTRVDRELLADTPVRLVASATSGSDHVDTEFLRQGNIGFAHAPGCNARSVAEYVLSSLLVLAEQRQFDLTEKTVGIIGCGHVGTALRQFLEILGIRYLLNDPPLQQRGSALTFHPLEQVLGADIISLHTSLEQSGPFPTRHLLDRRRLALVNADAILVNASRGGVIDESALHDYIDRSPQASVVLDVWEHEPAINPLLLQKVAIATPHIAGYSTDAKLSGSLTIYRQTCAYFNLPDDGTVNPSLPVTEPDRIHLSGYNNPLEAIQMAVLASYDVRADSATLRQLLNVSEEGRDAYFSDLRNNYPVRREFSAMKVSLEESSDPVRQQLVKLGFKME